MERIKRNIKGLVKELNSDDIEMLDTTGIVLTFKENISLDTVEWICHLIKKPILSGGAALDVNKYDTEDDHPDSQRFIISALLSQLCMAAERYGLLKRTHEGHLLAFSHEDRHQFENYEDENDEFFTSSEKQFLLKELLDHVICEDDDVKFVPGFNHIKVYKNRPVLPHCSAYNIVEIYPLHRMESLKPLQRKWYMNYNSWTQPLDDVKSYFGETIALYFAFLSFYTKYLIPPAVIGFAHWLLFVDENKSENVWFAILNMIWATIFLELWKRRRSMIIYDWGHLNTKETTLLEKPRAEYKGHPRTSTITGLLEPYYPTWKCRMKMYLVSYPALTLSLIFAMSGMWLYFEFNDKMTVAYKDKSGLWTTVVKKTPGVIYATLIYFVNNAYGRIAVKLNDWENHKVQSSYNNHLIIKLVLFYFVNSFLSLFYIAFYLCDMVLLRQQLATLLITQQLIQQVQESFIPYIKYKRHCIQVKKDGKTIKVQRIKDPTNQVIKEGKMPNYLVTSDFIIVYFEIFSRQRSRQFPALHARNNHYRHLKKGRLSHLRN